MFAVWTGEAEVAVLFAQRRAGAVHANRGELKEALPTTGH